MKTLQMTPISYWDEGIKVSPVRLKSMVVYLRTFETIPLCITCTYIGTAIFFFADPVLMVLRRWRIKWLTELEKIILYNVLYSILYSQYSMLQFSSCSLANCITFAFWLFSFTTPLAPLCFSSAPSPRDRHPRVRCWIAFEK